MYVLFLLGKFRLTTDSIRIFYDMFLKELCLDCLLCSNMLEAFHAHFIITLPEHIFCSLFLGEVNMLYLCYMSSLKNIFPA